MSLASCPKCWDVLCTCGHEYKSWSISQLDAQIVMLNRVRMEKALGDIELPGEAPPPRQPKCPLPDVQSGTATTPVPTYDHVR